MTKPAPSLRLRLTTAVMGVLGLSLCTFSLVLHATFSRALFRQFDERLAQDARTIASLVEERAAGPWEFEPGALETFEQKDGAEYFEVWMDDGVVLARSGSLGLRDLQRPPLPVDAIVADTRLPNGHHGHLLLAYLLPRHDEEGPPYTSGRRITVAVARATDEMDATMATLRLLLWGSGLTALALAALAGSLAIRSGLAPIARLAARIDAMDAVRLGERLPVEDLPRELRPVVIRLNELLARLEKSFTRERQFSSDVSHELRTPLAGLRSILEVASLRERPIVEYKATLQDALHIAEQISGHVETLLMLPRLEARQVRIEDEEIGVRELVDESFIPFATMARERRLSFDNQVPAGTSVISDREKLRLVLSNLLANAVEYTAESGRISVESAASHEDVLTVCDSGPAIPEDALERIFDRFFRLDSARAGSGEHCGVGLALTRALCEAMGLSIIAENRHDGSVAFRIRKVGASVPS